MGAPSAVRGVWRANNPIKQGEHAMQGSELLQEGLALMGLGMGFVFVFLTILVISVTLMSKLIDRFQPAPVAAPAGRNSAKTPASNGQNDEVAAVISAAVHRYRSSRRP